MTFATETMVKDRLDELNQTAHDPAITRYLTYAHSRISAILRTAELDPADVEANSANYLEYEMLQGAEADLCAGMIIQAGPVEDEASRYSSDKPHVLVSQGLENASLWANMNLPDDSDDNTSRKASVVLNQVSNRRDYSSHY